jgi:ribose transport system permease protein
MDKAKKIFKSIPIVTWFIILMVIVFSFFSNQYLTIRNLRMLLQQGSVLVVVSAAATFVIISGGLDLSLGGILTASGVVVAICVNAGMPIPLVILIGGASGFFLGAINGILVSYCELQPFIATLGTQGIFYAFALIVTNKVGITVSSESFAKLGGVVNNIPMAAVCCLIIYIFAIIVQDRTKLGRYLFAIGGNDEGTRLSGVNTKFWRFMVYGFAGFLVGLGSVILVSRLQVADPIVGQQWEFEAIATTVLGGTSFNIGKGDVKGTIIGVALLTVLRSGLNVIRVQSILQPAIIGVVIILAIVFQIAVSSKELRK